MLNPFYMQPEVLRAIKAAWRANGSVALGNFLMRTPAITGWKRMYVPDRFSYEGHPRIPEQRVLSAFVREITGKRPVRDCIKRFGKGDYTILHDKDGQKPGIVALLFLDDWKEEWGGKVVFMRNGKTLEEFTPRKNTLLIVKRNKGVRYFIKYINHNAGRRKLTIIPA